MFQLPIQIDIIRHKQEVEGKSTSVHAKILSPENVSLYIYPDIPDYSKEEGVYLLYPAASSTSVEHLLRGVEIVKLKKNFGLPGDQTMGTLLSRKLEDVIEEKSCNKDELEYTLDNLPIKKAVLIDATWSQSRSIYKDPKINSMKAVVTQNRLSQFWRHQKGLPRWCLATIEAIHQLCLEIHIQAFGLDPSYHGLESLEVKFECLHLKTPTDNDVDKPQPYNGQYDNLLFYFKHLYGLIHEYYDENTLKAYRRPIL